MPPRLNISHMINGARRQKNERKADCVSIDYRRFLEAWAVAHRQDSRFPGITLPLDVFELPSPQIAASAAYGHVQQSMWQTNLPILPPPAEEDEDEGKDKEDIKGEFKYNTKEDLEENIKVFQEEFGKEINEEINEEVKDQSVEEIEKGVEKAIKEEVSAERFKKAKEQFEKDDEKEFADREEPEVREEVREEVEEKIEGEVEEGAREEVREEVEDDRVSEADHDKDIDVSRPRSEKPLESHPLVRMFNVGRRWFDSVFYLVTIPAPQPGHSRLQYTCVS